jgi:hypothetical protein
MPSKLVSYALSGKPLLALVHREGPAWRWLAREPPRGTALWFDEDDVMPEAEACEKVVSYLGEVLVRVPVDRSGELEPYLSGEMARRHAELFDRCAGRDIR